MGARPPGPATPPSGPRPAQAGAPPRPAPAPSFGGRKDPFGLGAPPASARPAAPPPPPAPEDDWSDIDLAGDAAAGAAGAPDLDFDVEPQRPPTPAPIELPEEPGAAPELAPMHAFVPPPEAVGHRPEADGGEAALRSALSSASREVIERVVWEVVPQLAETIIRENLDRLTKKQGR
jgi:hypothetical protein